MKRWILIALATLSLSSMEAQTAPRVDHHQHLFGPDIVKLSGVSASSITASDLVALLDSAGIRRALILSVAYMYGNPNKPPVENEYQKVKAENDWTSQQIARFPDRLRGFCGFNPVKDYALAELARCAKDQYLHSGVKMHFGNSDIDLHNPKHVEKLRQVFHAANANRMPIVVHLRSSVTRHRPHGRAEAEIFLKDVVPSAPDVPIQIAHLTGAGGYDAATDDALSVFVDAIARQDPRAKNLYFDVSGGVASGLSDSTAKLVATRIRQIGINRILYGSDGAVPGNTPREAWAAFRRLPLTNAEFDTIANNVATYMR